MDEVNPLGQDVVERERGITVGFGICHSAAPRIAESYGRRAMTAGKPYGETAVCRVWGYGNSWSVGG